MKNGFAVIPDLEIKICKIAVEVGGVNLGGSFPVGCDGLVEISGGFRFHAISKSHYGLVHQVFVALAL